MEHWLVTFSAALPADRRAAIIREAGAALAVSSDPVPMGSEVVVQVDADRSAVAALRARAEVIGVYPDSEQTLY